MKIKTIIEQKLSPEILKIGTKITDNKNIYTVTYLNDRHVVLDNEWTITWDRLNNNPLRKWELVDENEYIG